MNSQREEKDGLICLAISHNCLLKETPVGGSDNSKDEDEKIAECWNSEVKQNLPLYY